MYRPSGVKEVSNILSKSDKFLVYYDPDIDGLIAGYLVQRFLKRFGFDSLYYINKDRQHGFKLPKERLKEFIGYTFICVDFSMTREEIEELTDLGINVINIDHHHIFSEELILVESSKTGAKGVVVNNQYPFEPKEYEFLSGAGVVYYVLKALYPPFAGKNEQALVGISLLSDIRPIENPIAKKFLDVTYTHRSPLTEYLVEVTKDSIDFGFGVQTLDRNYIDYTFSPKINALLRLNKVQEAINIIHGVFPLEYSTDLEVYKRLQNSIMLEIIDNLQGDEYENLTVKYVDLNLFSGKEYNVANFIGLACSQIKNLGKTTFLYVRDGDRIVRGSVRGLYDNVDYLQIFRDFGFKSEGHKIAFGVMGGDLNNTDFQTLNDVIKREESSKKEDIYKGRILDVSNLQMFLLSKNIEIARINNYVRDSKRFYIRYTGKDYKRVQKGKMWEFHVDGVVVKCFEEDLTLEDDLILPIIDRGNYIQLYLHRRIK